VLERFRVIINNYRSLRKLSRPTIDLNRIIKFDTCLLRKIGHKYTAWLMMTDVGGQWTGDREACLSQSFGRATSMTVSVCLTKWRNGDLQLPTAVSSLASEKSFKAKMH